MIDISFQIKLQWTATCFFLTNEKILLSSWPTNETVFWKEKFWCVHKRSCIITNDVSLEMKFSGHWKTFEGWNWRTCFFFVTMSLFFWKTFPSHLQLNLCTEQQQKKCIHNSMLLWKTDVKMTVKEDKMIYSKVKSYFRRLLRTLHFGKTKKFRKFYIFSCLVKWNWWKHFLYW